jgi:hypothetical protein
MNLGVIHRKRLQRFAVATQEVHTAFFHAFALSLARRGVAAARSKFSNR